MAGPGSPPSQLPSCDCVEARIFQDPGRRSGGLRAGHDRAGLNRRRLGDGQPERAGGEDRQRETDRRDGGDGVAHGSPPSLFRRPGLGG